MTSSVEHKTANGYTKYYKDFNNFNMISCLKEFL